MLKTSEVTTLDIDICSLPSAQLSTILSKLPDILLSRILIGFYVIDMMRCSRYCKGLAESSLMLISKDSRLAEVRCTLGTP